MAERKLEYCDPVRESQRRLLKDVFVSGVEDHEKEDLLENIVYSILEDAENPLLDIVSFYQCLPDQKSTDLKSLTGRVVCMFYKWVHKVNLEDIQEKYLTSEVKDVAFVAFSQFHCSFLDKLEKIYLFNQNGHEMFVKQIENLSQKRLYKDAMELACHAGIFHKYDVYDFVIPLFLQDKSQVAVTALLADDQCHHLKVKLVKFLDNLLEKGDDGSRKILEPYKELKIMTLPFERFQGKTLEKLIARVIDELDLGKEETCAPSFYRGRLLGNIRYQVYERYKDDKVKSDIAYFELLKHTIDSTKDKMKVLTYLIEYLLKNDHIDDAMRWAIAYNRPIDALPSILQKEIRENPRKFEEANKIVEKYKNSNVDEEAYLEDNHPIHMIDDWEALKKLMEEIKRTECIGLDSEFKPCNGLKGAGVALLQCSLVHETYLVDIFTLENSLDQEQWRMFLTTLLCGDSLKLGFDFLNDMQAFFNNPPFNLLQDIVQKSNVICLKRLVENIIQVDEFFVDFTKISKSHDGSMTDHEIGNVDIVHFGLGDLAVVFCGVPLKKGEQCSNWNLRPLRREQKIYAAMDAYIVTQIFSKIKLLAEERGLVLDNFVAESIVNSLKKAKVKKDKVKIDEMEWAECIEALNSKVIGDTSNPRKPKDLKCIVDMMLIGLGKNLRRIGVDVVMCDSKPQVSYEAARRPERIIFTAGRSYDTLRMTFPSRVVCIQNVACNPLAQLKKVVEKYNLVFDKKDIFSRCIECNCEHFLRAPSIVLRALHYCQVVCAGPYHFDPFDYNAWFDKLQEASNANTNPISFRIDRSPDSEEWISVTVEDGVVDITRNIVLHRSRDSGIPCAIAKVPEQVFHYENRFFYICCQCGKVYWDGKHKDIYSETMESLSTNFNALRINSTTD
ncbi:unnamed protein product [Auanema sp. JU1783]|nr:unnamed protein product [Auanema sp. JU1783]